MKYLLIALISLLSYSENLMIKTVYTFDINSTINPATYRYLEKGFEKLDKNSLALIKLNTPGGLVSTTKQILTLFGNADFPIAIWVSPEGSSATSAGALISAGADYLFMNDGTNIGAATPITTTGENIGKKEEGEQKDNSDLRAKAINDLVALTKALSVAKGRNADAFALMISQAKSFTSKEALSQNVINQVTNTPGEIINYLNDKTFKYKSTEFSLQLDNPNFVELNQSILDKILNILSHPQLAYILFLLGAGLIYFELQAPGGFVAGALGLISLLIAGIGFQVLPINFAALGLIALSLILFIMESYITSYGVLFLGAMGCLLFGSLLLFDTPDSLLVLDKKVIFSTIASLVAIFGYIAYLFYKDSKNMLGDNFFVPTGKKGKVFKVFDLHKPTKYQIKIEGQFWNAFSADILEPGDSVKVVATDKEAKELVLEIKKSI